MCISKKNAVMNKAAEWVLDCAVMGYFYTSEAASYLYQHILISLKSVEISQLISILLRFDSPKM